MKATMRRMIPVGALGVSVLLLTGAVAAIPLNDGDDRYFYVGEFRQYEASGIQGTYALSGLQGCGISVYTADGSHLLDITYRADHIDISLQVLENTVLNKLLEKEQWLEQYMRDIAFQHLSFEQPEIRFTYGNCTIEMHDSSITFLKIYTTGPIVFSGLCDYTLNHSAGHVVQVTKENFSGAIMSSQPLCVHDGTVIAQKVAMFRGSTASSSQERQKTETVERALEAGLLGAEITVVRADGGYRTDAISYFNNVTIRNGTLNPNRAEFTVSGDHYATGKTVKINMGKDVLSSRDLQVLFDGEPIPLADDLEDVLNPDDDGLQPEYVMVNVTAGDGGEFFLLVSIPHFSEHTITVESVLRNPVFLGLAAVGALTVVMVASWALFRKR
ncbi:MAG TPA: hypothetical protein ENN54_05250 [Thermoplasmatales archaeon]|nr:hypothetical protein [Thermoplasmatales archaeon]